jgi:glycogen operon protein
MLRFCQYMTAFRSRHEALRRDGFFEGHRNERGLPDISWHGTRLDSPGWNDPEARVLAFTLAGFDGDADIHVMMNMYWDGLHFELPTVQGRNWHRVVDTGLSAPEDCVSEDRAPMVTDGSYGVGGRSVVVLVSK